MSTPDKAMMDKIAAKFSGLPARDPDETTSGAPPLSADEIAETRSITPDAPDAVEPESTPKEDVFDFEWEGAKYALPTALRGAFEKASDYTRKTQELAEQRRAVDQARERAMQYRLEQDFEKSVEQERGQLKVCDAYLQQAQHLNWAAMSTEQMMRQRIELDQVRDQRAALAKSIDDKRSEFNSKVSETLAQLKARSRELAAKSIPNYGEETETAIKRYAMSEGLSEAETDSVLLDPRSAKILWKASQFDRVKAGTAKAVAATKAVRPGVASERMPADVRAKLEYGKAMKHATTSGQKAQLIEDRLAASPLFSGRKLR